jgi:geranylgeranyl reductase family protein
MSGVDYDVIIVGAGTAGCYLAKRLVKAGLDIALLEQSARTKADSGIVSSHFFEHVPDHSLIKARIKAIDLVSPNGTKINIRSNAPFAFVLNREKLGKKMRASVRSRIINERFTGCEIHKGWVDVSTDNRRYSCKVLVGADGTMSAVRNAIGIKPPETTWGLIDRAESRGPISVYFSKHYSADGFAWRIPQNNEIGVLSSTKPMEYFANFAHDLGKQKLRAVGSPIPVGTCRSYSDRCLLVGDAAGQVKPLTGGGMVWGLRCAEIAAKAVEYAFDADRYDAFFWKTEYERKWQAAIGKEMKRQLIVRSFYRKIGNEQINGVFETVKPRLERIGEFDYDSLSELVKGLPKFSLAKAVLPALVRSA